MEILSAYPARDDRWLGSQPVAEAPNKIPAAQELLRRAVIEGWLATSAIRHRNFALGAFFSLHPRPPR